jgi:hypothetical protein
MPCLTSFQAGCRSAWKEVRQGGEVVLFPSFDKGQPDVLNCKQRPFSVEYDFGITVKK